MADLKYSELKEKYSSFEMPIARVLIGGKELKVKDGKQKYIGSMNVELTAGYEAGIATFLIYNAFNIYENYFDFSLFEDQIQIGKPITLCLGYHVNIEIVFMGYISGLRFIVESGRPQCIEVTAMDVKGQMMANSYAKQLKESTYSAAVKEILSAKPYSEIMGAPLNVSQTPDTALKKDGKDLRTIDMVDESDYEFVVKAAKKFGFDFFSDGAAVYFRPPKSNTTSLIDLKYGEGLLYSSMNYSLTGMVETIEVRSSDTVKGESFSDKKSVDGNYSTKGSEAKQLIKGSTKVYMDPTIESKETATKRAEALIEDMKYRFGTLEAECVGIPDLKPGRFIKMCNLMKDKPAEFYVTTVIHNFSGDAGYTTKLIGKAKTLPK